MDYHYLTNQQQIQMKTYKLVKKYPGSLEIGTEVVWGNFGLSGECYQVKVKAGIFRFAKETIENNSEFWQEVEQPEYEVLEVKLSDDTILTYQGQECIKRTDVFTPSSTYKLDACLKDSRVKINSVKRLSDGLIIKVGNKVTTKGYMTTENVTGFILHDGTTSFKKGIWVETVEGSMHIERVKEVLSPIYTTYDGVEVYSYRQVVFWVIDGKYEYALDMCAGNVELIKTQPKTYKVFSTKEAAEDYVKSLTPLFVTEDLVSIYPDSTYWCVNTAPHLWTLFEQTAKDRTKLNKTVKAFSTKEAATNYITRHRILFTTEDGISITEGTPFHYVNTDWSVTYQAKALVGNGQYSERKYFFSAVAAHKYVEMKRPCFSIEDCLNIREEWHSNRLSLEESLKEYIKKNNK